MIREMDVIKKLVHPTHIWPEKIPLQLTAWIPMCKHNKIHLLAFD